MQIFDLSQVIADVVLGSSLFNAVLELDHMLELG